MVAATWSLRCERSGFFITRVRLVLADGSHVDFGAYPPDGLLARQIMTLIHEDLTERERSGVRIGASEGDDAHRAAASRVFPRPRSEPRRSATRATTDDDLEAPTSSGRPPLPMFAVPCLTVTLDGLRKLPLDPSAGYLVSLMDGHATLEAILDVCELDRERALEMFARLLQLEAIELRDP